MECGAVMAWVWHPHEPQLGRPLLETVGKGVVFFAICLSGLTLACNLGLSPGDCVRVRWHAAGTYRFSP